MIDAPSLLQRRIVVARHVAFVVRVYAFQSEQMPASSYERGENWRALQNQNLETCRIDAVGGQHLAVDNDAAIRRIDLETRHFGDFRIGRRT